MLRSRVAWIAGAIGSHGSPATWQYEYDRVGWCSGEADTSLLDVRIGPWGSDHDFSPDNARHMELAWLRVDRRADGQRALARVVEVDISREPKLGNDGQQGASNR